MASTAPAQPLSGGPAHVPPAGRTEALLGAALIASLAALLYLPALEHEFLLYDDRSYIVENPGLELGLGSDGIVWAFTTSRDGNWMPVTWLSLLADAEIHGLSETGVHGFNILLHALSSALLFVALLRMTGASLVSAFVAAAFATHPIHVESVAWAIERKDVLSGFFFHALLLSWAMYAQAPSAGRYGVALLSLTLGLLSKPMLVTAPFVLLLLDYWPLGRLDTRMARRHALLEKLPMFLLVGAASAITLVTQDQAGAMKAKEALPILERAQNGIVSYAGYLGKAVWPVDLAIFYPHPHDLDGISASRLAWSAALLLGISALAMKQASRRPHWIVGWLWYLGMLVPVIGIVQVGMQGMADRYMYLPLTGLALAVATEIALRVRDARLAGMAATALAAVTIAAFSWLSHAQLATWSDSASTFAQALRVEERNPVAHNGLGIALLEDDQKERAIVHLRRALELDATLTDAHVNLGVALIEVGAHREAIAHLERGLRLSDFRLSRVHANLGMARARTGDTEAAVVHYREALQLEPTAGKVHHNLAVALAELGRDAEAMRGLDAAETHGVEAPELYLLRAQLESRAGRPTGAIRSYRRALELHPDWLPALNNLAWLLATEPSALQPDEAIDLAERAVEVGGRQAALLDTLSAAYAAAGRRADALRIGREAVRGARLANQAGLANDIEARLARIGAPSGPDDLPPSDSPGS